MHNRFIVTVAGTGFFFSRCSKKGLGGGKIKILYLKEDFLFCLLKLKNKKARLTFLCPAFRSGF